MFYLCKIKVKPPFRLQLVVIKEMKDRIRQIMESQHMTQQVFADFIGTTPATLSGIFNDRTRPTISIVEMIKKKIPDISTDWLMFGIGDMYQKPESAPASDVRLEKDAPIGSVMSQPGVSSHEAMLNFLDAHHPTPLGESTVNSYSSNIRHSRSDAFREEIKIIDKPQRRVTEIRVYYDDQTWESFVPSKK